jgi:hypothetical protein
MSATEIIQQLETLPQHEKQQVLTYLQRHLNGDNPPAIGTSTGVSDDFKKAADEVFTKNAELFRKLAQ